MIAFISIVKKGILFIEFWNKNSDDVHRIADELISHTQQMSRVRDSRNKELREMNECSDYD